MSTPPDPLEALRMLVREIIRWAEYEPEPGEAVRGEMTVTFETEENKDA